MKKFERSKVFIKDLNRLKYGKDREIIEKHFTDMKWELTQEFITENEIEIVYQFDSYWFKEGCNNFTIDLDFRVEHIKRKKAKSVELIKAKKYKKALKLLKFIEEVCTYGVFDEDKAELTAYKTSALMNMGLCHWKTENWREMKKISLEVVKADNNNIKAIYRAALADFKMLNYEEALDLLSHYKSDSIEDRKDLEVLEKKIKKKVSEVHKKEKMIYKNVLG